MDQQQTTDERVKSDEAAMRRVANSGGVGAFAVAQAAPGGRRQGPRVRRSASARRRARQRAGLEPTDNTDPSVSATSGGGGGGRGQQVDEMEMVNPDSLIAADVEMDTYGMIGTECKVNPSSDDASPNCLRELAVYYIGCSSSSSISSNISPLQRL